MQRLKDIVGNSQARTYLSHMIEHNRVHHTLLFHGPQGVGKATYALAFARELDISPVDITCFEPEGKANIHTIESMQQVKKAAREHPFQSDRKLLLIKEADKMLPSSANALLKTLEEPLDSTLIILTTTKIEQVLETIQSRACLVPFRALTHEEVDHFLSSSEMTQEQRAKAVKASQGSIQKALAFESEIAVERDVSNFCKAIVTQDPQEAFRMIQVFEEVDIEHVLTLVLHYFRDLVLERTSDDTSLLFFPENAVVYASMRTYTLPELSDVIQAIHEAYASIEFHLKNRSILEGLTAKLIQKGMSLSIS